MVGHFPLQSTDVCWEESGEQFSTFIYLAIFCKCVILPLPTMYQVFTLRNVCEQLVECLIVLYETLKVRK